MQTNAMAFGEDRSVLRRTFVCLLRCSLCLTMLGAAAGDDPAAAEPPSEDTAATVPDSDSDGAEEPAVRPDPQEVQATLTATRLATGTIVPAASLLTQRLNTPLRPGDVISVTMRQDEEVRFEGGIGASGVIILPFLGPYFIAGQTPSAAAAGLQEVLEDRLYEQATVAVSVVKPAPGHIFVYGAVKEPGKVVLPELSQLTVLQALSEVGGITNWAVPEDTYVLRPDPDTGEAQKIAADLTVAFADIGGTSNLRLRPDDIVFVPSAAGTETVLSNEPVEIIVTGEVNRPGIVYFAPGEQRTFIRAVFKAGNFTRYSKGSAVRLIRYEKDGRRTVRKVDADHIIDDGFLEEDFELKPGDMIIVDEKLINF